MKFDVVVKFDPTVVTVGVTWPTTWLVFWMFSRFIFPFCCPPMNTFCCFPLLLILKLANFDWLIDWPMGLEFLLSYDTFLNGEWLWLANRFWVRSLWVGIVWWLVSWFEPVLTGSGRLTGAPGALSNSGFQIFEISAESVFEFSQSAKSLAPYVVETESRDSRSIPKLI